MHIETERKFLVHTDAFYSEATASHHLRQGYIARENGNSVRIRIWDSTGIITIKGPSSDGISRTEWELEIPLADAEALINMCQNGIIDKTRYIVPEESGLKYEVDVFHGENEGLVMAEIELSSIDQAYAKASWLGEEVTGDPRFYNSYLARRPFKTW